METLDFYIRDPLKSIDELWKILDTECEECKEIGWEGTYHYVEKEGNLAIFHCSFSLAHLYEVKIDFETPKEKIEEVIGEIQGLMEEISPDSSEWQVRNYIGKAENLAKKLEVYVNFASSDLKLEFRGYCPLCFEKVPVRIEDNKVWCGCSYCAINTNDVD